MLSSLLRDLRQAVRANLRDRGFAATVVVTLLVCIAANALTFAVVNSVLLRPLPVPEANDIVLLSNRYPKAGVTQSDDSGAADLPDRQRAVTALSPQALFRNRNQTIDVHGTPEQVRGLGVTASFFELIKTPVALGRAFVAAEGERGNDRKVILSHGLWQQLYGGQRTAIGQQLRMGGTSYEVVGVMPAGFNFIDPEVRLWTPLSFNDEEKRQRHSNNYHHIGRLKPGYTLAQAQSQVDALNRANLDREPAMKPVLLNAGFYTAVEPLQRMLVRDIENVLYLLWGAALLVLFIGALNVANLALARVAARRREVATRQALGASRWQLTRQSVLESVLVTGTGGLLGVALAYAALPTLAAMGFDRFPRAGEVRIDAVVALTSFFLAVLVGVLMGLLPVAGLFRASLSDSLREGSRGGTTGTGTRRLRQTLVAAEVGFAFVLLVGAGLLLSSFRNLLDVNPGYSTEGVLTASLSVPQARYPQDSQVRALMDRLLSAVRQQPGVVAAGATNIIPLGGSFNDGVLLAEGYVMKPGESVISPHNMRITPGYFQSLSIGLVGGRDFDERDRETSEPVVIVDEQLAQRFWPGRNPVGLRVYSPDSAAQLSPTKDTRFYRVVGVVKSIRLQDLASRTPNGIYYFPYAQQISRSYTLTVKTQAGDLTRALRAEVQRLDPQLALFDVRPMTRLTDLSLASRRTSMNLALAFGTLALFLSGIGIYGVLAYLVTQRRREIGIRLALGSSSAGVVRLVLREGLVLAAAGLAVGLLGSIAMQRAVANEIYGIQPLDPTVLSAVILTLTAISLAASLLPARRALQVDPASVLSE